MSERLDGPSQPEAPPRPLTLAEEAAFRELFEREPHGFEAAIRLDALKERQSSDAVAAQLIAERAALLEARGLPDLSTGAWLWLWESERAESGSPEPEPIRRPARGSREALRARLDALRLAARDPHAALDLQASAADELTGDVIPVRIGLVLEARAVIAPLLRAVREEAERRIALWRSQALHVLALWEDDDAGGYDAARARFASGEIDAPSLPTLAEVGADVDLWEDDPFASWDDEPRSACDEELERLKGLAGIPEAEKALRRAEEEPAVLAALAAWAEREHLLGTIGAARFCASHAQVRAHLTSLRFDVELLAGHEGRRDVSNGSLLTQLGWALDEGLLDPASYDLLLETSIVDPRWTGT